MFDERANELKEVGGVAFLDMQGVSNRTINNHIKVKSFQVILFRISVTRSKQNKEKGQGELNTTDIFVISL